MKLFRLDRIGQNRQRIRYINGHDHRSYQAWGSSSTEQTIVTSARHFAAICRALEILEQVHGDLIFLPQDILAQALKAQPNS